MRTDDETGNNGWNPTQRRRRGAGTATSGLLADDQMPAEVYVPAHPVELDSGGTAVSVELFEIHGFGTMAVAFSSEELLVARLGEIQPWALFDSDEFESILVDMELDIEGVLYDPEPGVITSVWTDRLVAEYEARFGETTTDGEETTPAR